ncbi:MAG: efflux RND transporter permease subunit [Planctomycetota bacterium]
MIERASAAMQHNGHLLLLSIMVLIAGGVSSFLGAPKMEDPRIRNRNPTIITAFPGASAERVDALVTEPLEDAVREVAEVKILKSESRPGISLLRIELDDFAPDPVEVFSRLRDKIADIQPLLPTAAGEPFLDDQRRAVGYSLIVALRAPAERDVPLTLLGRLSTELANQLRSVPGTEVVRRFGAPDEEIAVLVAPDELAALQLTVGDVAGRIAAADAKVPAGIVRSATRDFDLETSGELDSLARIAAVPLQVVPEEGAAIRVGDVAELHRRAATPPSQMAFTNGERAIFVAARITERTSIGAWTTAARGVVADFAAGPAAGLALDEVFVQQRYVNERLGGLGFNLLLGGAVVLLVVLLLMGFRAAIIVGSALPLCAASTVFVLSALGIPIHQMSIFGMIIALGLLIDNAIVVTDEIAKQRREGAGRAESVAAAVRHLRVPLLSSTITTVLSFAPILLLPGNVGDFIGSIAVSVITAILASFGIAMTITAALAGRYLPEPSRHTAPTTWRSGLHTPRLRQAFEGLLAAAMRRPLLAALAVLAVPATGFLRAGDRGLVFFPPADRDQFQIEVWLPPGSSIDATAAASAAVEAEVRQHDTVRGAHWVLGGSFPAVYYNVIERRDFTPHLAHGIFDLTDTAATTRTLRVVERSLRERFPELQVIARRFGQGPPIDAPVELRVTGPSATVLRELGEQVAAALRGHPAVLATRATIESGRPKVWIDAPEDELRMVGLTPTDVSRQVREWLDGAAGGTVLEGPEEIPVRVQFPDAARATASTVLGSGLVAGSLPPGELGDRGPEWIPLSTLGALRLRPQTAAIARYGGRPANTIEAYLVDGVNPPDVSNAVLDQLTRDGFALPAGYQLSLGGDAAESGRAIGLLLLYAPVLVTLMVASLVLAFRSFALAALMAAVAIGAAGCGMLALGIAGFPLGFNPFLGTAGLIGLAFNDAIVVLAAIRAVPAARLGEVAAMTKEVIGCTRHVLSTTFTTMGGFLPLLLLDEGDFWPPIAVVIGGGVFGSTLLALGLVPAMYRLIGAPLARRAQAAGGGS